ncbi:T9SS type B sorting domain-containing protein [Flavobacterium rivulicola]|nr:T9SS type B sorting domain-containing protein [Flavobacterium sp. IMCC34852]
MKKVLTLLLSFVFANTIVAQVEPNDCVNALTICGNGTFFSNANGIGNTQEINACGGFESNSLWLEINIVQGGTLGFNLIPDDPSITVDYDFWVFGPNPVCGSLGAPIRCATTNPQQAGLTGPTANWTGMYGSTLNTQVGPGPNGNGYVRWLNVLPGQSYYIAIDRPNGDGGFQIQWIGSATAGTGAFPSPPSAASIPDVMACSSTPNVGIYDLNTVRPLINADTTGNTITFHETPADANDNVNALPNIYSNLSNPQTLCARVTDNVSNCFSIVCFNLVVNLIPTVSMSVSPTSICTGDSVTVTFSGTPGANFDYIINGGPTQNANIDATGSYVLTQSPTANTTYALTGVRAIDASGTTICSQPLNQSVTVTVNPLPTATISGTTTICSGNTTTITFNGTPNATVTYTVNGGGNQTIVLDGTGSATITTPILSADATYSLVSVASSGTPVCSQTQTGSAVITVIALPTATISGTTSVCSGSTTNITFNGTPNATVTYTVNGGANQTIVLDGTGSATLTTPALTVNTTYALVSVAVSGAATCSQTQTGSAVITINSAPTATISGTTTICSGSATVITFNGTPNATVTYTVNSGTNQTILLNGLGSATLTTPALTTTTAYDLVQVTLSGTPPCSQTLVGSALVTVNALPTATISGTTTICSGTTTVITFNGTPNATVAYTVNGGANQTIVLNGTGSATITTPILSANSTYTLVNVTASGSPACSQTLAGSAVITVNSLPTATISGTTTICSGSTTTIAFNGTPNATVTYTINGGANQTLVLNASGSATLTTSALTANTTYALISVTAAGIPACSQTQTGSAVVTVNALPIATISGTTTICSGNTTVITFSGTPNATVAYTVNGGANQTIVLNGAGSANFTTPTLNTNTTYTLVSVTAAGVPACSQIQTGSAVVTVNASPTVTISGTTTICSGNTAVITFNGTANATVTYTINGGANQTIALDGTGIATITTPVLTVNSTYTLVSVASSSAPFCSQTQSGSAIITVNPLPVITNVPSNVVVCSGEGVITNAFISTPAGASFSWTNSLSSIGLSASGTGSIPNFVASNNGSSAVTAAINIVASLNNCSTTGSYTITVNPLPLANPVITDYELCDYANPGDGIEVFTLNSKDAEIANGQANVTIGYYLTQSDAQTQTSPLPNLYTNISNPQEIWINISNNTTGCSSVSSFNLVVNPLPSATTPDPIFQCSNGATTQALFDLTINEGVVTAGNTSLVSVTYYNSLLAAQNESSPIVTPSTYTGTDNEIVYIRVEDNVTGCYSTTTQLLRVTQGPIAVTPQALHYCDPNNDGFGVFDLASATAEIAGGVWPLTGVSISYYETQTDALIGAAPSLASPYDNINPWTQTIYVRVFYTLTGCANYVELQLIVDPTPEATEPDDYALCDYTGQTGFESFDLTTTIPQVLGSIDPTTVTVTFHTTFANAQDDANAIGGVTNYINQTQWNQTVYVRVEFNTTGCYDIVELDLIVNPLPNATQPNYAQYTLCDYNGSIGFETFDLASQVAAVLLGQTGMSVTFYPSLTDAENDTNAINVSHPDLQYPNQIIYVQTLGIRITNSITGCYSISTMDIRVVPLPTPIPPTAPFTICDENQDGFSGFDLTSLTTDILQGAPYILTFHETLTDAQQGNTPIDTSVLYNNINPFVQILYVRAVDPLTGCWSVIPIELNVNPSPIAPVDLDDIVVCDDDNNTQDAITSIDLTVNTASILAQQPLAASNYTVEYYTSQTAAQDGIAPIINVTNYTAMNNQTIWVRVEDNTTGCFNIGSFDVIINIPLLLTTPAPLSVCDNDTDPNNQYHSFDLTVKDAEITQGLSGYTVTYYPSLSEAQAGGATTITDFTAYTNIFPAVQTLGVLVTSAAGCQSITTLDIRVLPVPTPNTDPNPLAPLCDDNNPGDMVEVFDVTVNAAYIINGATNVTLTYYTNEADAHAAQFPIADPTQALVGDNVWIRVENNQVDYLGNNCYVLVEQPLTVNPLPEVIQPLAPYRMCDDNTDGIAQFDLTNPILATAILGANQSPADFTITYYLTAAGANPFTNTGETPLVSPYTNITPDAQDIYIRVVNNATGCVNATGVLTLAVEEYATATGAQEFSQCDDYNDPYDGVFQLDLTQFNTAILNGQDPAVFLISYYHSQADAEAGINAIPLAEAQAYITQPDTDQIWVKVENSSNSIVPFCYALTTIDIEIERYPNPVIDTQNDVTTICVDFTTGEVVRPLVLESGIVNASDYTFEWYEDGNLIVGATGSTYTVNTSSPTGATRNYHVRVISNSDLLCETTSADFPVIQSGQAVIASGTVGYTVTNAFTDSQIITVTVEGWGTYEYSLDDGPRQSSNIFEGVSLGEHVIHVWDTEGGVAFSCEELTIDQVMVIDYPRYFTPNGDGIHDAWNIVGLSNFAEQTTIYIFDRYGKLLKQLSASDQSEGWDGTYNGKLLPSDDYWFTVDFPEQGKMKQFKAHFTLKR